MTKINDEFINHVVALLIEADIDISEEKFWEIVESVDWTKNSETESEVLGEALARRYPLKVVVGAMSRLVDFADDIQTEAEEYHDDAIWDAVGGGEDGMSDLCHHIVGMGKEVYLQMMKKPEKILALAEEHKYVESFKYVFDQASQCYKQEEYTSLIKEYLSPPLISEIQQFKRIQAVMLPNDKPAVLFYYEKSGNFLLLTEEGEQSFKNKRKLMKGVS